MALETISSSKEAKHSALCDSMKRVLGMVNSGQGGNQPRKILEPLPLTCETRNEKLMIASLDCISRLWLFHHKVTFQRCLLSILLHTITACHTETARNGLSPNSQSSLVTCFVPNHSPNSFWDIWRRNRQSPQKRKAAANP